MILWNQHNVGDAGIRSETRYQMFYRREHDGPLFYVPVVRGTPRSFAVGDVQEAFNYVLPQVVRESCVWVCDNDEPRDLRVRTTYYWSRGNVTTDDEVFEI